MFHSFIIKFIKNTAIYSSMFGSIGVVGGGNGVAAGIGIAQFCAFIQSTIETFDEWKERDRDTLDTLM